MKSENTTVHFYNKVAERYFEKEFAYDKSSMLEPFEKELPRHSTVLEIGGGGGRDATWMTARGHRVVAIDNSTAMLQRMKLNPHVETHLMDMRDIHWENTFDGALAVASLMHITKTEAAATLRKIFRALKPAGMLLVTVTAGQEEGYDDKQRYFANYTATDLKEIVTGAGFYFLQELPDVTPCLSTSGRLFRTQIFRKP